MAAITAARANHGFTASARARPSDRRVAVAAADRVDRGVQATPPLAFGVGEEVELSVAVREAAGAHPDQTDGAEPRTRPAVEEGEGGTTQVVGQIRGRGKSRL